MKKASGTTEQKKKLDEHNHQVVLAAFRSSMRRRYNKGHALLRNIKRHLPKLREMMARLDAWDGEDRVYRYYHGSFKVYQLQYTVQSMVKVLKSLSPSRPAVLCPQFMEAVGAAMGDVAWEHSHNGEWEKRCRPFVDSYFHAEYFLRMAVKYGETLKEAPDLLPSGWAALLELYGIR
jgi:hypothetical protein